MKCSLSTGLVMAALFALSAPSLAFADSKVGDEALEREEYELARREFKPEAESGDSRAQYHLAILHQQGLGGPRSRKLAAEWFRKAATQGVADAAYALGLIYANGDGLKRDLVEAYTWFRVAGQKGHEPAKQAMRQINRTLTLDQVIRARKAADQISADP